MSLSGLDQTSVEAFAHGRGDLERLVGNAAVGAQLGRVGAEDLPEALQVVTQSGVEDPLAVGAQRRAYGEVGKDAALVA